jgi:hypothetical protein
LRKTCLMVHLIKLHNMPHSIWEVLTSCYSPAVSVRRIYFPT